MKEMLSRAKRVVSGEDGASNMEFIIIMVVALLIAAALFLFGDKIISFLGNGGSEVDNMSKQIKGTGK